MEFFYRKFKGREVNIYPLGDWHIGSRQCNEDFVRKVVGIVKDDPIGYWIGMSDFMENALIGSKSDVYTQTMPPREQMEHICDIMAPIASKGLWTIAGNHEERTMRVAGIRPEEFIAAKLNIPFMGFSVMGVLELDRVRGPYRFSVFCHHNYGGGYTVGGKANRAEGLRKIVPTADATFSGHFHITSRIPYTWFEAGETQVIKRTGYDYITGSALTWNESYAEEKAKPAASVEHIKVTFGVQNVSGNDGRYQKYEVITA